jgi:hypothetical protein
MGKNRAEDEIYRSYSKIMDLHLIKKVGKESNNCFEKF